MDTRLSQAWNGWRASARHKASTPDEPELHRFSDGAMHTALMAAVISAVCMAPSEKRCSSGSSGVEALCRAEARQPFHA